ncbi:unnamed protein product, partial [Ranitomeya imitator]
LKHIPCLAQTLNLVVQCFLKNYPELPALLLKVDPIEVSASGSSPSPNTSGPTGSPDVPCDSIPKRKTARKQIPKRKRESADEKPSPQKDELHIQETSAKRQLKETGSLNAKTDLLL